MKRTQIYLTEQERKALERLSEERGTSKSSLIREAIDQYLVEEKKDWREAVRGIRGMWKDREDLPDFKSLRKEWNRYVPGSPRYEDLDG